MHYLYVYNPFANPIFFPVLARLIAVFAGGFALILSLNSFQIRGIFKTNVGLRYLSWLILAPIYMGGVFLGGPLSLLVLFLFMALALFEICRVAHLPGIYRGTLLLLALGSILLATSFPQDVYVLPLLYFLLITIVATRMNDGERGFQHAAVALFASIWIIFSLSHFILLGQLNNRLDSTHSLLVLIGFAVPLGDIGAYLFGRFCHRMNFLDRYKIASNISPNKTYIGILGNIAGAGLGIWLMYFIVKKYLSSHHWAIIAALIGVSAVIGDLTESLFKRYYQVKDSSHLIPGHGGMLDRIDSVLRVIVTVYYYLFFGLRA